MDLTLFQAIIKPEQIPLLAFAIVTLIGIVNMVQIKFPVITGIFALLLAVALGVVAGIFGLFGMTVPLGLLAGFAGSGVYKLSQVNGTK